MITTWEEFFGLRNGKYCADSELKAVFDLQYYDRHQRIFSLE